jgi:hypothetical protein
MFFFLFVFFFPPFLFSRWSQKLDLFVEPQRVVKTVEFLKSRVRVDERRVAKVRFWLCHTYSLICRAHDRFVLHGLLKLHSFFFFFFFFLFVLRALA